MLNPVATTGLLVAAYRAEETKRSDRLFDDPFAATLAGSTGFATLEAFRAHIGPAEPFIEVRTRYLDDALARAQARGLLQVVILAAGMDARAYRLPWLVETRLFEIDQPSVMAHKSRMLAAHRPRCERHALASDLATDWPSTLVAAGFDAAKPTVWVVEGLLQYLPGDSVKTLFARIDVVSVSGSTLLFDLVGETLHNSPQLAPMRTFMEKIGAPWLFASDDPSSLLGPEWLTEPSDAAAIGGTLGRWPSPAAPPDIPGIPRAFLVEARKR
jgi:methyltransferase (TIGR00027 family)